jgi:hypothetical protein
LEQNADREFHGEWRGPQLVQRDTERSYLKQIESRLPPGVTPLAAFFLRTTNDK